MMDPSKERPSTPTTARPALEALHKAELNQSIVVSSLKQLSLTDFGSSDPENERAAIALLAQHRIASPLFRAPEKQKRDFFRTDKKRKAARDEANWKFTKHEAACTFDKLLSDDARVAPGVAQAVLSHAAVTSVDELWSHFHDAKFEKKTKSAFRSSKPSPTQDLSWLGNVTLRDDAEYVRLICQAGVQQDALDRAFAIALGLHSMEVMRVLLAFKARASACQNELRSLFAHEDIELAKLLLSADPCAMSIDAWRYSLAVVVAIAKQQQPSILLLCLANRPGIVCPALLLGALASQNLQSLAALLAYASEESSLSEVNHKACWLASNVEDSELRFKFFSLLFRAGLVVDGEGNRQELLKDVDMRHFQLVNLMVDAGVAVDVPQTDAVSYAVLNMDLDVLEQLQKGVFTRAAVTALKLVPESVSESQLLRLVNILAPRGLLGQPLDTLLVRAASKGFLVLAEKLVAIGASIEFRDCQAIQIAISTAGIEILRILLKGSCTRAALSVALPTAMSMQSRPLRQQAMEALLQKGVQVEKLGIPLQKLIHEVDEIDSKLVETLLLGGAPIDGVGDNAMNVVLHAAGRCDLPVLKMLCNCHPSPITLDQAVQVAFEARRYSGYDKALKTMAVLLTHGATGPLVNETLLAAITEDDQLEMVRILVDHGAEANFSNGAAFGVAMERGNSKLLGILCTGCPPSQASIEGNLYTAVAPQYYDAKSLEFFLRSSPAAGAALNAAWDPVKLKGNPNLRFIIPCFLRYGLNVDLQDGAVVVFALQENDIELLRSILLVRPNTMSLSTAFQVAVSIESRQFALQAMRLLLETANSAEIGQSNALLQQTCIAFKGDLVGLNLLLQHMADVDFDNGVAISAASIEGDIAVLEHLLRHDPATTTLHRACIAVAASSKLGISQKQLTFKSLLGARGREMTKAEHMSRLLADSVIKLPDHAQLPGLLIRLGVQVDFGTFATAVRSSSPDLFRTLLRGETSSTITSIFRETREANLEAERKHWIYELLLAEDVSNDEISEALIDALRDYEGSNLDVPKLLLEHGASVTFESCAAFDHALRANSLMAVQLLSQYLLDDNTACVAFDLACKATSLSPDVRVGVYTGLLQWNINTRSLFHALIRTLADDRPDERLVQLLLDKDVDPNQEEARCFVMAAATGAESIFRHISRFADTTVVLRALMKHFRAEWEVVLWLNTCLEEQHHTTTIDDDDLLYECMRKLPAASGLVRILLERGVSPAASIETAVTVHWAAEPCTPLIWALLCEHKIENDTILTLIEYGGMEVLPTYSTPTSGVTAAFACLLDQTRTPILEALLLLDWHGVIECVIPAATFRCLGTGGINAERQADLPAEIPLRPASMFLGNLEAYKAMKIEEVPDDGALHTAAMLALPTFVAWLLNFHDPNAKVEDEFEQMIPLAMACRAKSRRWCKIANQESDHASRQKQCILLLGPKTNTSWRYRHKNVLHEALDSGLEVTKVMLEALGVKNDAQRDERYLYQDKDGIQYSLHYYVVKIMRNVDHSTARELIALLLGFKLKPRYFRSVMPGEGEQPDGYEGLPAGYAKAWEEHEALSRSSNFSESVVKESLSETDQSAPY